MTQLALAVDADDELWTLDNLPTPEAPYVEVGDELIEVRSRFPSSYYTLTGETLPPRIRVRRGIAGTTKASHIQGSTLTPNYGLGSGGGGGAISVDNTVDAPEEVTTIIAPGSVVGGGVATLLPVLLTAPVDTDADLSRDAETSGSGDADASSTALTVDGEASVASAASATGDGTAVATTQVTTSGAGAADATVRALTVDGLATADLRAQSTGTGNAQANHVVIADSGDADAITSAATTSGSYADVGRTATASGGGDAYADADASSPTGAAYSKLRATTNNNSASIGVTADNATRAELQVNALPLYTQAAGAPGGTFVSLFYRDTTGGTGGTYLWDFVAEAYTKIALALA